MELALWHPQLSWPKKQKNKRENACSVDSCGVHTLSLLASVTNAFIGHAAAQIKRYVSRSLTGEICLAIGGVARVTPTLSRSMVN